MNNSNKLIATTALTCSLILGACGDKAAPKTQFSKIQTAEALAAHSAEFKRGVEQVTDGVWIAIGYGLANSVLIEGDDGLIVVDTMETMEEGRLVAEEFRKLSDKPLKAIIYTHNHTDHVFGAEAMIEVLGVPDVPVRLFAHNSTASYVHRIVSEYRPIITARSFRMFGSELDDAALVNNGIGPRLAINAQSKFGFIDPTDTFEQSLAVTVAGVEIHLQHAPGETNDQLYVWLPELGVLCPGDNLYKTFPNLYTVRGTPYRSLKAWAASIDKMRALPVRHVAPSHTRPIHGEAEVHQVLTDYRDAIRYVHDQTVRWINAGLTPDEITQRLQLPPHLAESPWLAEFYGTVEWSSKSVFAGNLGWFDGNPASLRPLPPQTQARKLAELAGGEAALAQALTGAAEQQDWQWALQLSDALLRLQPDNKTALDQRVQALVALGEAATNPNARHYYLMSAAELRDGLRLKPIQSGSEKMIRAIPLASIFDALAVSLRAEEVLDVERKVAFSFTDSDEQWTLLVRRGVLEVLPRLLPDPEIHARVDSLVLKQLLGKQINPALALARDFEFPVGNAAAFAKFLLLFRPEREAPEPAPFAALQG